MNERTKYLLLIIKTYIETRKPLTSEPTEPMFDLQIKLYQQSIIRQQKIAKQKEFVTKDEFYLQCELALDDLKEYGYMQYSIDLNSSLNKNKSKKKLQVDDINSNYKIQLTDEEKVRINELQIDRFLVDLSKLDPVLEFEIHNWEIDFIHEIFQKLNHNLYQKQKNKKEENIKNGSIPFSSSTLIEKTISIPEKYGEIFSNNGFELFEYILDEFVKPKNSLGRYEDLSYFYRCLFDDNYIHQRPEPFRLWFMQKYSEEFSKIKTKQQTNNSLRKTNYSNALERFKSKNN